MPTSTEREQPPSMRDLLAAGAAASAVSTPPRETARPSRTEPGERATTVCAGGRRASGTAAPAAG